MFWCCMSVCMYSYRYVCICVLWKGGLKENLVLDWCESGSWQESKQEVWQEFQQELRQEFRHEFWCIPVTKLRKQSRFCGYPSVRKQGNLPGLISVFSKCFLVKMKLDQLFIAFSSATRNCILLSFWPNTQSISYGSHCCKKREASKWPWPKDQPFFYS